MIKALQLANLAVRFGLELGVLGLLSYWGFSAFAGMGPRVALGIGAPLALAILWGLLAAPQAPVSLAEPLKTGVQVTLLLVPAAAVAQVVRPTLAAGFAAAVAVNAILLWWWQQ